MKTPFITYIFLLSISLFTFACSSTYEQENVSKKKDTPLERPATSANIPIISSKPQSRIIENGLSNDNSNGLYQTEYKKRTARPIKDNLQDLASRNSSLDLDKAFANKIKKSFANVPEEVKKTNWALRILFDNDIWNNTDYYYTNGVNIELITPFAKFSPINKILLGTRKAKIEIVGFSIRQNMYTPTNPDVSEVLGGDRPFAAFLTIGHFRETYNLKKKQQLRSGLEFGVLGPASLGGVIQTGLHTEEPVGWQNQIQNSFVISYFTKVEKGIVNLEKLELNATVNATIGTLFNKVGGGFFMRFGRFYPVYSGPLNLLGGSHKKNPLQFWFFAKGNTDVVIYDATLQGGLFSTKNPHTISSEELSRFVYTASAGIAVYSGGFGLELENFIVSPEFSGGRNFGWGRIKLTASF